MLKTYKVTWYEGDVTHIDIVLKEKLVKADSLEYKNMKKFLTVLPKRIRDEIYYTRQLLLSDKHISVDYGSYTKFIWIEEI